jgi:hypothetical protein
MGRFNSLRETARSSWARCAHARKPVRSDGQNDRRFSSTCMGYSIGNNPVPGLYTFLAGLASPSSKVPVRASRTCLRDRSQTWRRPSIYRDQQILRPGPNQISRAATIVVLIFSPGIAANSPPSFQLKKLITPAAFPPGQVRNPAPLSINNLTQPIRAMCYRMFPLLNSNILAAHLMCDCGCCA